MNKFTLSHLINMHGPKWQWNYTSHPGTVRCQIFKINWEIRPNEVVTSEYVSVGGLVVEIGLFKNCRGGNSQICRTSLLIGAH